MLYNSKFQISKTNNFSKSGVATCPIMKPATQKLAITLQFHEHACSHKLIVTFWNFVPLLASLCINSRNIQLATVLRLADIRECLPPQPDVWAMPKIHTAVTGKKNIRSRPSLQHRFTASRSGPPGYLAAEFIIRIWIRECIARSEHKDVRDCMCTHTQKGIYAWNDARTDICMYIDA